MKQLRKFWSAALLALGLCLFMAPGAARAQISGGSEDLSQDWSLRIGVFILHGSGDLGISGMVERRVHNSPDYDIMLGVGYNGLNNVYSVPIMLNVIGKHANGRYGGGIGYSFGKRSEGNSFTGVAFDVVAGYTFVHGRNPMNVDLRWYFISGANSELDGPSITLGVQF
ncbi:MAG TPA: hypothetical protein VFA07_06645 [Chthonomonadaceae bacterium]|nr:hypothetical protein [Chthonomonadaceae bacterium]